jgi:hypothetical protein
MTDSSITPPPELVEEWVRMLEYLPDKQVFSLVAQWGADRELEACCQALYARYDIPNCMSPKMAEDMREWLRAARRPKPPSLKEKALEVLSLTQKGWGLAQVDLDTIRRALEALPE